MERLEGTVERGAPRRATRWWPARLLLAVVAVAGCLATPHRLHAHAARAPDLVPLVQAYTAAWNAHDLAAVLAFFAPDAVVRERRGDVPPDVWDSRDPQVVRAYLDGVAVPNSDGTNGLEWATGRQQIGAWAAARFLKQYRSAAGQPHTAGDTVRWSYQEFSDPFQRLRGIGPLEGTAEAAVRGGKITVLTLVLSPESVERWQREVRSVGALTAATRRPSVSPIIGGGVSGQPRGLVPDGPAAPEPTTLVWPLALSGLALLAALTASWRRRRVS